MNINVYISLSKEDRKGVDSILFDALNNSNISIDIKEKIISDFNNSLNLIAQKSFDLGREFEKTQIGK